MHEKPTRVCTVGGCDRPISSRGLCKLHYERQRIHGSTDDRKWAHGRTVEQRLAALVVEVDGCHRWTGALNDQGYGQLRVDGKALYAHRLAWEMVNGPIPDGHELDHLCHDRATCAGGPTCPHRACCNPEHLEPVTHIENVRRGSNGPKTHCPAGHPYSGDNLIIDQGWQRCRTCIRARVARRKAGGE